MVESERLPKGLRVRRRGEALETTASKTGEVRLLFARDGTELVEATVRVGKRVTIVPAPYEDAGVTEAYYLLRGALRSDLPGGPLRLEEGDVLIVNDLEEPTIFLAETEVTFLYVTSQPAYRYVSTSIRELRRLAVEVEQKDGYTASHCERLQALSYQTGERLGLSHERLHRLQYGAYLHDAGKIDIPLSILTKPGVLTLQEWEIVKQHPIFGRERVEETFMRDAAVIVEQHHERFDGSGYPYGLGGEEVLTESYIVAVADSFDAMTTKRPYRRALDEASALAELRAGAGRLYKEEVVEAFVAVIEKK